MAHMRLGRDGIAAVVAVLLTVGCGAVDDPAPATAPDAADLDATTVPATTVTSQRPTSTGPASTSTSAPPSWTLRGFGPLEPVTVTTRSGAAGQLFDTTSLAAGPDGLVAVGSGQGDIRLFEGSRFVAELAEAHDGPVSGLAFLGPGGRLASAGQDGAVRVWDTTRPDGEPIAEWEPHDGIALSAIATTGPDTVATGGADDFVRTWELGSGDPELLVDAGPTVGAITSLAADDGAVVVGTSRGLQLIAPGGSDLSTVPGGPAGAVTGVAADGLGAVGVSGDRVPLALTTASAQIRRLSAGSVDSDGATTSVAAFAPPGSKVGLVVCAAVDAVETAAGTGSGGGSGVGADAGTGTDGGGSSSALIVGRADGTGEVLAQAILPEAVRHLAVLADGSAVVVATATRVVLVPLVTSGD